MKITRKNLSTTKVMLTVSLDAQELAGAEQVALVHMSKDVKVPGFRPGKAPIAEVKKRVAGEELQSHLVSDAINRAVPEALNAEKLQALDRPEVEVKKIVPGELLEFTLEVEVLPKITLGDYKKLKVDTPKISVTKKDIDEVIERMRQGFADKKEISRAAKMGDEVVIDFKGTDDKGVAFAGGEGKDYSLILGSNSFIPGFEEGIVGHKTGETFKLSITFPKVYHAAHLAGKKASFEVTIKTVKEVKLPPIDDDFAAKCGPFKNIEELRADIKKEITAQREHQASERLKDQLVEQLVKASSPPVPEILIKDHMKNIETDFVQNLLARGMSLQQFLDEKNWTREEWEAGDLREAAIRRVQSALVLSELSKVEKIEITQDELTARHQEMLQQYPDPNMRLQLETPEARADLSNRVLTEKTLERLIELNVK
jgi:trigger factor